MLEHGKPTKAGEYDDVVLFNSPGRTDVNEVIQILSRRRLEPGSGLFSPLTFDQYGKLIRDCSHDAKLGHLHLTPHCLRHSGASHDSYHHLRDIKEIQARGRWKALKSVSRYKRPGRMLLSQSSVSPSIWKEAQCARAHVLQRLRSERLV